MKKVIKIRRVFYEKIQDFRSSAAKNGGFRTFGITIIILVPIFSFKFFRNEV
jgi:hypothetical protein